MRQSVTRGSIYDRPKLDQGYIAGNGEHLSSYVSRLKSIVQSNRSAYAPMHETWYTHRAPNPCWICNSLDVCEYLVGLLEDIVAEDKKRKWICEKPKGSHDPLTYVFKPHSR